MKTPSVIHVVALSGGKDSTAMALRRDTWPASLDDLAKEFERGRPIRGMKKDALSEMKCRVCRI